MKPAHSVIESGSPSRIGSHCREKRSPLSPFPSLGLGHMRGLAFYTLKPCSYTSFWWYSLPCLSLANSYSFFKAFKCHLLFEAPLDCPVKTPSGNSQGECFLLCP